ncbi:extracellular solute-binding protein [Micrococcales bacterium 31B]|nr:extracellular solute-binding protein [Micrococcales bacterium 31B]
MSITRRTLLRLGLAATTTGFALPALAACGSGGTAAALQASATPPGDLLRGVTLNAMVNQPHALAFTKVLGPAFASEFGGTLTTTAIPYDQLTSKQILDAQSGAGTFDVFDYFYFGLGSLVDANALVDLTDWLAAPAIAADVRPDDFLPSIYDPYTLQDGRRYGLPYDGDTHLLFVNTEVFEKYGVEVPGTWDAYDEAAAKITQDSRGAVFGAIVPGQQVPMILGCSFINRLAGYGGELVDASGAPQLVSPAAVAALDHLVKVAPSAYPTVLQTGFDQANAAWLGGKGAMLDTWTDMSLKSQDPGTSQIVDKWTAVPLPVGGANTTPRTALNSGFGLGVSTGSAQPEAAAAFVQWATSIVMNQAQATFAGSGIDPARASVLNSAEFAQAVGAPAVTQAIRDGLGGAPLVWPSTAAAPQQLQDLTDQLALAIQGKQSVQQSLENAQTAWESA